MSGSKSFIEIVDEVSLNLGGDNTDRTRIKSWVNFAYIDLCSWVSFPQLKKTRPFYVYDGISEYTEPTDLIGIETIELWDATTSPISAHKKLVKLAREPIEPTTEAQPDYYIRREGKIVVSPVPDQTYEGQIVYVKSPSILSANSDKTILTPEWDLPLIERATAIGFAAMGNQENSDSWNTRFFQNKARRTLPSDIEADSPKLGLQVAWSLDDLQDDHRGY